MKHLIKLPQVNPVYIVSSEDDSMYAVVEHKETLAHIVETIDGTRQTLYFPDGGEMHFQDTDLHQVMSHVASRTKFDMACMWFQENEFSFIHDRGNGSIDVYAENPNKTQLCYFQISNEEISLRAQLWIESRK
jgi:hypothetical protein